MIQRGLLLMDRAEGNCWFSGNKDFKTKHRVLSTRISHTLSAQRYQASFVNDLRVEGNQQKQKETTLETLKLRSHNNIFLLNKWGRNIMRILTSYRTVQDENRCG